MNKENKISLDGQVIEINKKKYALLEFKNSNSKPLFKVTLDLTTTKIGENIINKP